MVNTSLDTSPHFDLITGRRNRDRFLFLFQDACRIQVHYFINFVCRNQKDQKSHREEQQDSPAPTIYALQIAFLCDAYQHQSYQRIDNDEDRKINNQIDFAE